MSAYVLLWVTFVGLPSAITLVICLAIKVSRMGMTPEQIENENLDQLDALRPPKNKLLC